jgi:hypothetical protein
MLNLLLLGVMIGRAYSEIELHLKQPAHARRRMN